MDASQRGNRLVLAVGLEEAILPSFTAFEGKGVTRR